VVALEGRPAAALEDEALGDLIEFTGRDAGAYGRGDGLETVLQNLPSAAERREFGL
jgi:hypothetical protein